MNDSESRRQAELLRLHNEMMRARQAELLRQSKVTTKLEEKIRQSALLQVRAGQTGQTTHKATNEPSRAELIASFRTFTNVYQNEPDTDPYAGSELTGSREA